MDEFQRKKKIQKIVYSKVTIFALIIVTLFMVRGAISVFQKQIQSQKNLEKTETELILAKAREEELKENIEKLETPHGIESEIRAKFNVKKEGEDVIILVDPEEIISNPETEVPFWSKIGNWFKGIFQ